jgi:hypothetical protein
MSDLPPTDVVPEEEQNTEEEPMTKKGELKPGYIALIVIAVILLLLLIWFVFDRRRKNQQIQRDTQQELELQRLIELAAPKESLLPALLANENVADNPNLP